MKIAIRAVNLSVENQVRAYVEYRMFSAVSQFGGACVRLSIRLEERPTTKPGSRYRCSVILKLIPAGRIRAVATAGHLYAAIDAAAERLARSTQVRFDGEHGRLPVETVFRR
jgi:ribosomal subunit interface protein